MKMVSPTGRMDLRGPGSPGRIEQRAVSHELHCQFCQQTECLDTCDWPVERFVPVAYGTLNAGDLVRRFYGGKLNAPPARVAEFAEMDPYCEVLLEMGKRAPFRQKRITVRAKSFVRALREAHCEAVCCELHRADRGPGAVCCADHWSAWGGVS